MPVTHQLLVGIRTNVDESWWGVVRMCQPIISICSVQQVHRNTVAHGHNPTHSNRLPNCDRLVAIVIFMRTHTTQYYLESRGQVAYMKLTLRANSDYGEKVHHLVKTSHQRPSILGINWYGKQDRKYNNNKNAPSWSSLEVEFLLRGFQVASRELPQQNKLPYWQPCHFFIHASNSPPKNF